MAKYKIEWSTDAKLDLYDILEFYTKRNGNNAYSKKLYAKISKSIALISQNPLIGTPTDYDSVRIVITGDYQILYEIHHKLLLIVFVWDCRRDPEDRKIEQRLT